MKYLKPIYKPISSLKVYLKQRAGWLGIPKIIVYRGYGNEQQAFVMGRVLEDKGLAKPEGPDKFWRNIIAMLKRFSSDKIGGVNVRVSFAGQTSVTETDEMGFFECEFNRKNADSSFPAGWNTVQTELLDEIVENQPPTKAQGEILIIESGAERIVVSDIDDTVLVSHSTQTFRKLRLMLFKNARSRIPFEGVGVFYQALGRGKYMESIFPFFYVSSSEWNLYDLLEDFFHFNLVPKGVFLLRKLNHSIYKFWKSGGGNHEHKYEKIKSLMEFYPKSNFILVGDSGQQDPEIYKRLAFEFPERVEAIYIRKVKNVEGYSLDSDERIKLQESGISYAEVTNSAEASKHAYQKGFINANLLSEAE